MGVSRQALVRRSVRPHELLALRLVWSMMDDTDTYPGLFLLFALAGIGWAKRVESGEALWVVWAAWAWMSYVGCRLG